MVIELAACWAIVMALTGYYLFIKGRAARLRRTMARAAGATVRNRHAHIRVRSRASASSSSSSPACPGRVSGVRRSRPSPRTTTRPCGASDPGAQSNPASTLDESLPHSHSSDVPWAMGDSKIPECEAGPERRSVTNVDTALFVADRGGTAPPDHRRASTRRAKASSRRSDTPSTIPRERRPSTSTNTAEMSSPRTASTTTPFWPRSSPGNRAPRGKDASGW